MSAPFIHERAICESDDVGDDTRVWGFAVVQRGARVGARCNVCTGAFVEAGAVVGDGVTIKNNVNVWNGVTVEDAVFLGPSMTFTNDVRPRAHIPLHEPIPTVVRSGASIGANATVLCGIEIGSHALVAAGAVVTKDVAPHALVRGTPARQVGWVCVCAQPITEPAGCTHCERRFSWSDGQPALIPA